MYLRLLFLALATGPQQTACDDDPSAEQKKVLFHNYAKRPLTISFVPPGQDPEYKDTVAPGSSASQDTWIGHVFEVGAENARPTRFYVEESGDVTCKLDRLGKAVQVSFEWKETDLKADIYKGPKWDALVDEAQKVCLKDLERYPSDAAHFCNASVAFTTARGSLRSKFDYDDWTWRKAWVDQHAKRRKQIWDNPRGLSNFTERGFTVLDLPKDLHQMLWEYWMRDRRNASTPENHPHLDPNLSGRESDSWVLPIFDDMKEKVKITVKQLIAEWANMDPEKLYLTATYGLRLYRKNSKLHMHVDRRETHVLSAILEIGHLGWSSPDTDEGIGHTEHWPLEIMDHQSGMHHVESRPGQLILYESATCPHGRPAKYPGREMANIFIHFRPEGWPEDYEVKQAGNEGSANEL